MNPNTVNTGEAVALKEWASVIRALLEGKQIMLLRKGGITEETRDFQLLSPAFYLLPTFEHQRRELLKPQFQAMMDQSLSGWNPSEPEFKLEAYGEVTEDIEIQDQETLDKLRDYHIWTDAFAAERLKWKRTSPLHLLLVRIYALQQPTVLPMREEYNGCKSWVSLQDEVKRGTLQPVLEQEEYFSRTAQIKRALEK